MFGFSNKNESKQKDIIVKPPVVSRDADMKNSIAVFTGLESPNYNEESEHEQIIKYNVSHDAISKARPDSPIFRFYTNDDLKCEEIDGKTSVSIKELKESKGFFATEVCIKLNDKNSGLPQKLWLKDNSKHHFAIYGSDVTQKEGRYTFKMIVLLFRKDTELVYRVYSFNCSVSYYDCVGTYSFKEDATFIGGLFNILSRTSNEFAYDVLAGLNLDKPEVFL